MASRLQAGPEAFSVGKGQRRPRKQAGKHLAWIRTLPSVLSGRRGCDPCHIRYASLAHGKRLVGNSEKPDDCWTIPLTRDEHDDQHRHNERAWWAAKGIDPLDVAARLWAVTGDDEAGELIVAEARRRVR